MRVFVVHSANDVILCVCRVRGGVSIQFGTQIIRVYCMYSVSTNSIVRLNQTHAATHNICGLCVPGRRCPVVPLSLCLKRVRVRVNPI